MQISDYTRGRDNNFNLVRIVAASLVFISHSFVLSSGILDADPLQRLTGLSMGTLAVHVFFATSGFLVTGSMQTRASLRAFLMARVLRIYPGLWCALLISVIVTGTFFSTLQADEFWGRFETWRYLGINAIAVKGIYHELPGVFTDVPYKNTVNGSLWSLCYELRSYLLLMLCWAVASKLPSRRRWFDFFCLGLMLGFFAYAEFLSATGHDPHYAVVYYMFFAGAVLRLWQHRISMSGRIAAVIAGVLLLSVFSPRYFHHVYLLAAPWLVVWVALVPGGSIRKFNRIGDYSYGVYIYAFPIQQISVALVPGLSTLQMVLLCAAPILASAWLSWHLVEKPGIDFGKARSARFGLGRPRAA